MAPINAHHSFLSPQKTLNLHSQISSLLYNQSIVVRIRKVTATLDRNRRREIPFIAVESLSRPLRLCVDRCCHVFVLSFIAFSSMIGLIPVDSGAIDGTSVLSMYPCEDVSSYYHDVDGLKGEALMKQLNSIVSIHRSLPYKQVWDALKILDAADFENPELSLDVIEIYSGRAVSKVLAGKPEGWNREHLWPRSYGLIDGTSLTDLQNIRPADSNVNSARGNKFYGECHGISSRCLRPANSEAAPDTETDNERWAPPFQVRGDIARSLMYMVVTYGFDQSSERLPLRLSDSPSMERNEMGILSVLLRWNDLDPPSRAEQLRNERICRLYQHNRNPFVDHPEYANLIWKHLEQHDRAIYYPSMEAWINEFHYDNQGKDQNEFVEIFVTPSANAAALKLVLYNGADGKMYRELSLNDEQAFSVENLSSGLIVYTTSTKLQNGPSDGIALISLRDGQIEVLQFLSYEGTLVASDGPAKGIKSSDIIVRETAKSSEKDSLGLTEDGLGGFVWQQFTHRATPGKPNVGQRL